MEGRCLGSLSITTIEGLLLDGNTGAMRPRKRRVEPSIGAMADELCDDR